MLSGEGYAFASTADRVVTARDAQQAPLRDARTKHDDAIAALKTAQAAKPVPASRDRLDAAERALSKTQDNVRANAAAMGARQTALSS